jgi:hypothetical protein
MPTFLLGGFLDYFFETNYRRDLEITYSSGETYFTYESKLNPFEKCDIGMICGVGLKSIYFNKRELFFDLRYKRGFEGINLNTFSATLGIQIWK